MNPKNLNAIKIPKILKKNYLIKKLVDYTMFLRKDFDVQDDFIVLYLVDPTV